MRKINNLLLIFASILMILVSCSDEVFEENITEDVKTESATLSVTASIPTTRIALEQQEDYSVSLTWEIGDKLQLLFVQGDTKVVQSDITISDITNGGKTATFEIVIPSEITTGSFDLYGVYGGGGISTTDPTLALLPANPGSANSLTSVQDREDAMLYFSSLGIDLSSNSSINVSFKHIGSLFSINLKNESGTELSGIDEARLTSRSGGWAYNSGLGGGLFNLVTGKFENPETAGNFISFTVPKSTVASGETIALWGWYPPLAEVEWPNLSLQLLDVNDEVIAESNNFRPGGRTPAAAKNIYFNALWNGVSLEFANSSFVSRSGFKAVEERFTILQENLPTPFNIANQLVSMAVSGEQIILKTANVTVDGVVKNDILVYNALTGAYETSRGSHDGINRLGTDSKGIIIGTNNANSGGTMNLFKLETLTSPRETYYTAPYTGIGTWGNGGPVNVFGDITKDAVIFAPVARNGAKPATYRFVIESGVLTSTSPELIEYGDYTDPTRYNPFGNVGFGIPAGPRVEDGYIFGDREEFAYFVDGKKHTFKDEDTGTWTYGGTGGGKVFDMNGKKYFAVWRVNSGSGGLFNIVDITNPEAIRMTAEERTAIGIDFVPHKSTQFNNNLGTNGNSFYGNIDVKYLDNGNVMLYFMHGNSGVKAFELIANN